MRAGLPPYAGYKDSRLSWFGAVPCHWETRRLRNVAELRVSNVDKHSLEGELPVRLCNYVDVYKNSVIRASLTFMTATATPAEVNRFRLRRGDVLITKDSEDWQDIGVPAYVDVEAPDLICGYHLAMLRPIPGVLDGRYLYWQMESQALRTQLSVAANGVTRFGLSHGVIKEASVLVPPVPDQAAIARFLDHADRRINRYIRAKRRLIELLNEQKQAIIHQAVTRGLDPNVSLKPSGSDRYGSVPEHWQVARLDRFVILQRGIDITKEQQVEGVIPVVSSGGISSYHNQATSNGPGVVIGRKGTAGSVYFVESDYWAHDTTLWVRTFNGNDPEFIYYLFLNLDLKRFDTGSANPTLNRNIIHPERVAMPSSAEQRAIAAHLRGALTSIDRTVGRSLRQIDLIREYRTRLIADVVTGKLDVRGVELPELDEDEPLDDLELDGVADADGVFDDEIDDAAE